MLNNTGTAKWKTSKEITGVSTSSIVDFKAAVANEKNEDRASSKIRRLAGQNDVSDRNKGVLLRAKKDEQIVEEQLNQFSQEKIEQKLMEKSLIYDQFVQGSSLDPEDLEKRGYLVDFEQKSWDHSQQSAENTQFFHEDVQREAHRIKWEQEALQVMEQESREREKRREDRVMLNQIISETQKGREKALQLQEQRKRVLEARKLQVKKRAEAQKEKQETLKKQQDAEKVQAVAEKNKKRLSLKNKT